MSICQHAKLVPRLQKPTDEINFCTWEVRKFSRLQPSASPPSISLGGNPLMNITLIKYDPTKENDLSLAVPYLIHIFSSSLLISMYFSMYSMFLGHQPRNPVTLRTVQLWEPERIQASCDKTWPGSVPFSKDSQAIVTWRKAWENLGRNQKNRSGELEHDEHDGNSRMGYMSCVFIYI